jgi:TonB-dependent SusC/RagA subfamily outer membrane receptor
MGYAEKVNLDKHNCYMRYFRLTWVTAVLFLAVFLASSPTYAQNRAITGVITDQTGKPLQDATVSVKGASTATSTDINGFFRIAVGPSATRLVVSYVGAKPKDIPINGTTVSGSLEITDTKLADVVVIGYGSTRRANLTSAQTTVSAKDIEKTLNTTIEQAIQGRAAGVYVTQNSGQPGGGMSVFIRGISSINGTTEPLYVVDGVQMQQSATATSSSNPLAGLNPSDIEDIQVLQGPSATAIYGSRATNGVLLITTKRGKAGQSTLNYGFQYNIQTPPKHLDVMNLPQYAQIVK